MRPTSIRTLDPAAGPVVSVVGNTYRVLTSGEQTGGAYAVIDMLIAPGGGPPPHAHAAMQETFFVVEGEVVFRSETQTYTAGPGAFVEIGKGGAVHSFTNESGAAARLLCVVVPAGLEQMFLESGQPVAPGDFRPKPPMTPEALAQAQALARKYNQEIFPPDYLTK